MGKPEFFCICIHVLFYKKVGAVLFFFVFTSQINICWQKKQQNQAVDWSVKASDQNLRGTKFISCLEARWCDWTFWSFSAGVWGQCKVSTLKRGQDLSVLCLLLIWLHMVHLSVTLISSDYVASNDWMKFNWKGWGGNPLWPNLWYSSGRTDLKVHKSVRIAQCQIKVQTGHLLNINWALLTEICGSASLFCHVL